MHIRTDTFEDFYEVYEDLGSGQFAVVKRCKNKDLCKEFAAKFVTKRRQGTRKGLLREKILQEVEILSELKHKNIISLFDVFETDHEIILILELVSGGELFDYISEKDHLSEEEAAHFITQLLEGINHFHSKNILHLDLKPENVMLLDRKNCLIKIIDFGISRKLKPGEKVMETYGTPEFVAPEIIQYQPISSATDMWSVGVITYILLSGLSPFLGDNKQETFANITNIDYNFDDEYFGHTSELAKDFIAKLFVKDPRKRANVKDCLDHPWIKPLRRQDEEERRQAQINIEQFKSFIARRRWKQSVKAVSLCNKIIRKSQLRISTLSLENINYISFGRGLLDTGDDFALTALLCAAEDGDVRNLKDLLQITSLDINKGNKNKETALHMAASAGKFEIIKLLHGHKIDLHAQDNNGENSIHYCCRSNNIEAAKQIIDFLLKNGVSLDVQNKNGETALHIAARYGCADIIRYLCECGANLDLQDDQGETAIHVASWHGFPEIVRIFCHYGCDINLKNKEGETALITACARGYIESVKTLIEHKADLNIRDKRGNISLHWAVKRHHVVIALMLIQAECNMDTVDFNGETALHIACRENLLPVVQTMCALGCRVDIKNKKEMTPLHTATEKNEIDAVRCLCLAGLDLNITNKDGLTAEQLAIAHKHTSIANLLSSLRKKQCILLKDCKLNPLCCLKYRQENREIYIEQLVPTDELLRSIKIKIFGNSGSGKTTLIGSLKCSYLGSFFRRTRLSSKSSVKNRMSIRGSIERSKSIDYDEREFNTILDNYDLVHDNYTKGIEITNVQLTGGNHYSIWDFSGYEPYRIFYDHFIGDHKCVHVIVYSLEKSENECCNEIIYWLEFLRARIAPKEQIFHKGKCSNAIKVLLIGTHADTDKNCFKNEEGEYTSDKANQVYKYIFDLYQHEFDICNKHFILDARVAWVSEIKHLINYFNQLKDSICERLPRCTMFLSRTLHNVQNLRKTCTTYPIVEWKKFIELIREKVNPLASDEHFREVIQQLQLMGEVIYIEGNPDQHLVCVDPEWLCHKILGTLFSHERFYLKQKSNNGLYSVDDLENIFSDQCSNVRQLKDILIALDLCAEYDNNGDIEYEFSALNFVDKYDYIWDRQYKPAGENLVYNGFQIRCSNVVKTLIATMFPRIQVNLRNLSNYSDEYNNLPENKIINGNHSTQETELINHLMNGHNNNNNNNNKINNNNNNNSGTVTGSNSISTINGNDCTNGGYLSTSNLKSINGPIEQITSLTHKYTNTLYDIDLLQWRYGSKITRANSNLECLLTVDHEGLYIELKVRGPASKKEELFYFQQDINTLVQQVLLDSCPGMNLEIHYLSPIVLNHHLTCTSPYPPRALYQMQLDNKNILINLNNDKEKFIDIVCCGSEQISKNIILGSDMPINIALSLYTKRMLSRLLDDIDPMGRDWCLLAVILGLQEHLPKLENLSNFSKTNYLLDEWVREKQNATVRALIEKLSELGRKDVCDLVMTTSILFRVNISDDSGIRNSNQTLSSK